MMTYRCRCGQPLAAFVTGWPGTPLTVPPDAIASRVADALDRHRPHCRDAAGPAIAA